MADRPEGRMFQPRDPAIQKTAARIAYRCAAIIDAFLSPGTKGAAEDEFYKAARLELDRFAYSGDRNDGGE